MKYVQLQEVSGFPHLPSGYLPMNLMQALLNQENVSLSQKQHSSEIETASQSSKFRIRSMLSEVDFPAVVISGLGSTFPKSRHQPQSYGKNCSYCANWNSHGAIWQGGTWKEGIVLGSFLNFSLRMKCVQISKYSHSKRG